MDRYENFSLFDDFAFWWQTTPESVLDGKPYFAIFVADKPHKPNRGRLPPVFSHH